MNHTKTQLQQYLMMLELQVANWIMAAQNLPEDSARINGLYADVHRALAILQHRPDVTERVDPDMVQMELPLA